MSYDPFARGPFPAGVRTVSLVDGARDGRELVAELWYPAAPEYAGRDLDAATRDAYDLVPGFPPFSQDAVRDAAPRGGRYPAVVFSHGYGGHRRQSTFLCTHLASHGYVVAAVDHAGNTMLDVVRAMLAAHMGETLPPVDVQMRECAAVRPPDMSFLLDRLVDGTLAAVDPDRIGMTGHSFGGWTTIATTARDRRIRAAVPLAPAGGMTAITDALRCEEGDFAWGRDVPTLFIVADRDTLLPLRGMEELFARTQSPKRLVVLQNADHLHFCDRVEELHEMFRLMPQDRIFEPLRALIPPIEELCPGQHTQQAVSALTLAHMDAHLRSERAAASFLDGDVAATLATRGIAVALAGDRTAAQASA